METVNNTMKPLYGHTSPETAYVVNDYPYGFKLRCVIRYWIEKKAGKGFRFCSQTTNPKRPGTVWNKPKCSTYVLLGANMYLDLDGYVQWLSVTEYSDANQVLNFIKNFPESDLSNLISWCGKKAIYCRRFAAGEIFMTMNGVRCEETPESLAAHAKEAEVWEAASKLLAKE
jgi:hypothetical protein